MNDIYTYDFTRALPPSLKSDPNMLALAQVIAEQLQTTAKQIKENIIYARIDELDEQTLDLLAYDLHVDWYDYSYPVEIKRQTIKDSVKVHRRLGTKYAVETALGAVFPGTRIEEWFEYGGEPYTFRVIIGATTSGVSAERQAAVLERVRSYKNLRSHLDAISYRIEKETKVFVAAYQISGQRLEIYPYMSHAIVASGSVHYGGITISAQRFEISRFVKRVPTAPMIDVNGVLIFDSAPILSVNGVLINSAIPEINKEGTLIFKEASGGVPEPDIPNTPTVGENGSLEFETMPKLSADGVLNFTVTPTVNNDGTLTFK